MSRRSTQIDVDRELLTSAIGQLGGAVLVLDQQLRIRAATDAAERAIGAPVPVGVSAATLLCGDRPKRPFAEALAEGQPFQAVIPRPGDREGKDRIRVRSVPLPLGWLIYVTRLAAADTEPVLFEGMWTTDPRMKAVFHIIEKVAAQDATVLIRGETGTGKELVAHALHALSTRKHGPFRAINCAALPANLLESELFGHARGAFTGAVRDVAGHIELAHGGTLFLDEVAELSLELQAKLLRVVETRSVIPVGAREPIPVDVRIVSATHRSLRSEVEAGRFRADLMFRLRVIPIYLPALRERVGDIMLIAEKMLDEMNGHRTRRIEHVAPAAQAALERYEWPGNVRELRNVLEYAYAIGESDTLELGDLPAEVIAPAPLQAEVSVHEPATAASTDGEANRIRDALIRTRGNRERAAMLLGMSRATLWRRMREHGLDDH